MSSREAPDIPSPPPTRSPPPPTPHTPTPTPSQPNEEHPPTRAKSTSSRRASQSSQSPHGKKTALEQAETDIEIDDASSPSSPAHSHGGSSDDGYETDGGASSYTSLASSARHFAFENGRRYHRFREGSYNFPNDDSEQDREDMKHAMMVMLCGRYHFAPINGGPQYDDTGAVETRQASDGDGANILDMGTGTGIWPIEMGDIYPGATITGVDLSPIQPGWVPPNVKFVVDDLESPWLRPQDHYTYIHGRNTVMGIRDWPRLMRTALEHLKPGGWLELQEMHHFPYCTDGSLPPKHPVLDFWQHIIAGLAALGVDFEATLHLAALMRAAGFAHVTTRVLHVPIGAWPRDRTLKTVGAWWRQILLEGAQPIALGPLTRGLGWTREQVEVWLVAVRRGYADRAVHAWMPLHIICGQKPVEMGAGGGPMGDPGGAG